MSLGHCLTHGQGSNRGTAPGDTCSTIEWFCGARHGTICSRQLNESTSHDAMPVVGGRSRLKQRQRNVCTFRPGPMIVMCTRSVFTTFPHANEAGQKQWAILGSDQVYYFARALIVPTNPKTDSVLLRTQAGQCCRVAAATCERHRQSQILARTG